MKKKRARSRGVRHPVRNTVLFGLATVAGIVLVWLGGADMRETGRSGSPLLMLGLFPAILCPIFLVHYATRIRVFGDLRSGRSAIARWTVPADEFAGFRDAEAKVPAGSIMVNFYRLPEAIPAGGVDVIFSDRAVLIGDGYFPLSMDGGRQVESVRYLADPPSIEFSMAMRAMAQTSSATIASFRVSHTLRVPVAMAARREAGDVVDRFNGLIGRR